MNPDVLILDRIGGAYLPTTMRSHGLGGSEIEVLQVAAGLTAKGYAVTVANGVPQPITEDGIQFVPFGQAGQHAPSKALYLQRYSTANLEIGRDVRIVVRANDVYCPPYEVHRGYLETGRAALVANTQWQAEQFHFAKDRIILPPMLEPMPTVKKQKGLFVFASGPMKGLEATLEMWRQLKDNHPKLKRAKLAIVSPGWGDFPPVSFADSARGVFLVGSPVPEMYRSWIAKAEGLFMVSTMAETFCCAAALAERAGTRTHILCRNGMGGIPEALANATLVTEDEQRFQRDFLAYYGQKTLPPLVAIPSAGNIDRWEDTLRLKAALPVSVESTFAEDPTLEANQASLGPFFGDFLSLLRGAITPGGSEFGVGLTLFSLAASIRASQIVEIGRFKGFSTLALAAACHLQDIGWQECKAGEQRPDVNYGTLLAKRPHRVLSIDPSPHPDATALLAKAGLSDVVIFRNERSDAVDLSAPIDLLFIDGSHLMPDLRADVQRFVPWVRRGGYFILHDYFGWFDAKGQNGSAVARIIDDDLQGFERLLIDTGFASLVVFRKTKDLDSHLPVAAPRADDRPTVGLVMIAKGDEASTVATRAIVSAKKVGVDCVTIVCDAPDATADVARSLGADVCIRQSPKIDWEKGIGIIGGARNEALALAERRTDYVLMLDADDWLEGTLPTVLDRDAYEVTIHDGGMEYARLQLFRSGAGYRYSGLIHEHLVFAGSLGQLPSLRYLRGKSAYGYQDQDTAEVKFSKHATIARKWLIDHPDDARMQFYLARSLHDAGRPDEAIVEYEKRIAMTTGWDEERFYSAYEIGQLQLRQHRDPTLALLRAHGLDARRAEPLLLLARWYRDDARRQFSTAYAFAKRAAELPKPASAIFLVPSVYDYETVAELAICAYWAGQKAEAKGHFERLLDRVPSDQQRWATHMIQLCERDLKA